MMRKLIRSCLGMALMSALALAGDEAPTWLRQVASTPVPSYDKKVPAVVLLNESRVAVSEDGRIIITTYYVVRILT